jgi:hypothetical protein
MTLEATLAWGLHDAYLERIEIDWPKAKLVGRARGCRRCWRRCQWRTRLGRIDGSRSCEPT